MSKGIAKILSGLLVFGMVAGIVLAVPGGTVHAKAADVSEPGRAKAFEAAGKQGCDCVTWSRKRRTGFISRQGVYESPRSSFYTELVDTLP